MSIADLMITDVTELGLRERKKAKTRALILEVADRLFMERGYDAVTLDEVAGECDVSVRTVLRYFETKDALAVARERAMLDQFRLGLDKRRGDILGFWRYHIGMFVASYGARADWHRRRYEMTRSPALDAARAVVREEYLRLLGAALADEFVADAGMAPHLMAATLVAGNELVLNRYLSGEMPFDPDAFLEVVDFTITLFAGYLRASPGRQSAMGPGSDDVGYPIVQTAPA